MKTLVAYIQGTPVKSSVLDSSTGFLTEVTRVRGKLHDEGNEAAIVERDPVTGVVLRRMFYQRGNLHRDDGAAYIEYSQTTGKVTLEVFCRHGRLSYGAGGSVAVNYEAETGRRMRYDFLRPGSPPIALG